MAAREMVATTERCGRCGQFVGENGQHGAVAPSDQFGDPDYDREVPACSEACAEHLMAKYGWPHAYWS